MLKNTKKGITQLAIILIAVFVIFAGYVAYRTFHKAGNPAGGTPVPVEMGDIKVDYPIVGQEVGSPLEISGRARGSWFFEAVFPVKLEAADGSVIAQGQARASGNWMTDDFVLFDATINFSASERQNATLVFQNDNPSGLPENAKEFRIPVVLLPSGQSQLNFTKTGNLVQSDSGSTTWSLSYEEAGNPGLMVDLVFSEVSICKTGAGSAVCEASKFTAGQRVQVVGQKLGASVNVSTLAFLDEAAAQKQVYLYYYNPNLDKDASGNTLCSKKGLVPVLREIPAAITPIQDTINLLIAGQLAAEEKAQGITTEYPLSGFSLKGASLNGGILTLEFNDPNNKTSGGSCRAGILWFQIEATAKQFDGVNEVRFIPDTLFQP